MSWSPQQEAIFAWFANPSTANLVVTARAGTGKTTTGVEAVKRIVGRGNILYCAFNKRIADELEVRLANLVGVTARTFHSLGFMYLRAAWGNLKMDAEVEIERIRTAQETIDGYREKLSWETITALKKSISTAKGTCPRGDEDEIEAMIAQFGFETDDADSGWLAMMTHECLRIAKEVQDPEGRISFDDMLFLPVVNDLTQRLYDWVIVDEAQDTNAAQLELAQRACKKDGHIIIIGDDRQAIYGFRGADSAALSRMEDELQATSLKLTTTYRCPTSVVAHAKQLVPDFEAPEGAPVGQVLHMPIDDVLTTVQPGDVILSRTNAPTVGLCLQLIRKGVPARIEGRDIGKQLALRAKKLKATSVESFLASLRLWANTQVARIIAAGKFIETKCEQVRDIEATLEAMTEDCETLEDVYARCERMFEDVSSRNDLVVLSTIHKAKGLEWKRVFLLNGTLYVYGKYPESKEEQNIHYVALTRAQEQLVLVAGGE